jgi:hypothetical protein
MAYCNRVFSQEAIEMFREEEHFIERPFFKEGISRWA